MPAKKSTQKNMPLYFFIALLTFFSACGLLGSDDDKEPLEPGPRNYEWTVDSVYSAPGGWMNTIWGSSPNDVWIASSGGFDKLWHYDGKEWSSWPYREGPNSFTGDFYSIFGFAQNDVWMGGKGPRGECIWHFDGQEWKLAHTYQPEGMGEPIILDIWGTSPSDIYAVGAVPTGQNNPPYKGFILQYDGRRWKELLMTDFGIQLQLVRKGEQGIFIKAAGPYIDQLSGQMAIYKLNDETLTEIIRTSQSEVDHLLWVNTIDKDVFLMNGNNLKRYSGEILLNLNKETSAETVFSFFARHKKDVFLSTSDGVLHYNGEDVQPLISDIIQPSAVLLEKDVFFFANDYEAGTNLIYHGTLPQEEQEE